MTLLVNILAILIPTILIFTVTVYQANEMINDINGQINSQDVTNLLHRILDSLNSFLTNLTGSTVNITVQDLSEKLASYASTFASAMVNVISGWVGSLGSIITNVILYIYIFMAALIHHDKLVSLLEALNPLGRRTSELYLKLSGDMTKGMVKGQFIIAICQGTASATFLYIAGVPYFAFWVLLLSFMSLIPLGAGIITIPIGIGMMLVGNYWQGAVIILGHLLVVTNIDNVLRPLLVPKSVRLNSALTLLSVFAGMAVFGLLGIVVGPIIMILIITTLNIYTKEIKHLELAKKASGGKS
jgi:predicted PurR-regulated permease PerM